VEIFRAEANARRSSVDAMEPTAHPAFRIAIHRAKGCYFARVVDLPGCISRGASEVEAVENARAAIRAYLWAAQVLAADTATVELEIRA